jgi:hypothetical protein
MKTLQTVIGSARLWAGNRTWGLRNTNTSLELGAIPARTDALFC